MTTMERIAYRVKRNPSGGPRPCDLMPPVPKAATQLLLSELFQAKVSRSQLIHQLEDASATACDAGERIVRDYDGKAGLLRQELVDVTQERATAREDDTALGDVRTELGRRLFERLFHRAHNTLQRLLQGFENLIAVESEAAGHAFRKVAALDGQLAHLLAGVGRAYLNLDALGGGLADQDAVVTADVVHDGFVEAIAADAGGVRINDAIQRQYRDFRRT